MPLPAGNTAWLTNQIQKQKDIHRQIRELPNQNICLEVMSKCGKPNALKKRLGKENEKESQRKYVQYKPRILTILKIHLIRTPVVVVAL